MKRFFLTLSFFFACLTIFAQSFEGKIIYQNSYKSKIPNVPDEKFASMMGTIQSYYLKGGNYKSEVNGTLMKWQLYLQKDNKLYNKLSNSPAILWNDAAINSDMVISSEFHKNAITILGYPCNELVLYCKSGVQKYYFTSKFPVDPKPYIAHQFGNWYAYLSKAHAAPLKIIIDNAQFTMTAIATEVKSQKLDDGIFALPANAELTKSPY